MKIIKKDTTHFEDRKNGGKPNFLILHYTETQNAQAAEDYFIGKIVDEKNGRVSAHYMIDEDGSITQYVDEEKRAWHAGKSYWDGLEDINSFSIGIEIVNPGRRYGYRAFPVQQMRSVVDLCKDIMARHNIPPHRVLGHSDIAPARKVDPGELFDWKMLAGHGIGVWPSPLKEDFEKAADESALRTALTSYGYDPHIDFKTVVTAFQRHFYPEIFRTPEAVGTADKETVARLYALLRRKPSP